MARHSSRATVDTNRGPAASADEVRFDYDDQLGVLLRARSIRMAGDTQAALETLTTLRRSVLLSITSPSSRRLIKLIHEEIAAAVLPPGADWPWNRLRRLTTWLRRRLHATLIEIAVSILLAIELVEVLGGKI
jgi:hypothetical protein